MIQHSGDGKTSCPQNHVSFPHHHKVAATVPDMSLFKAGCGIKE